MRIDPTTQDVIVKDQFGIRRTSPAGSVTTVTNFMMFTPAGYASIGVSQNGTIYSLTGSGLLAISALGNFQNISFVPAIPGQLTAFNIGPTDFGYVAYRTGAMTGVSRVNLLAFPGSANNAKLFETSALGLVFDLVVDGNENIYLSEPGEEAIAVAINNQPSTFVSDLVVFGLALDSVGNIYASGRVFNRLGFQIGAFPVPSPEPGLAVAASGSVYVPSGSSVQNSTHSCWAYEIYVDICE
jgi:hypothetical protein